MNNTLKTIVWITAAIAAVSLGIATVLFFATDMREFWEGGSRILVDEQRALDVEGLETLRVRTSSTDVYLAASEDNRIEVRLHGTVTTNQSEAVPVLAAVQSGEVLEISTERRDGRRWTAGFFLSDLILEIHLPRRFRGSLAVKTSSGDVQIDDQILSELFVETSSGTLQLHSIQADTVVMESSSGDQAVEGMRAASSEMTSSSGEIAASALEGALRAKSSSGDIILRCAAFTADLEVRSSSGEVELYLTEGASFLVEAKSSSGDISCTFPITLSEADSQMSSNRLFGRVGEGTHRVVVKTSSGDITIRP